MATLSYRRNERTTLYIQTQEGDVVRLRIKVRDSFAAATASAQEGSSKTAVIAGSQLRLSLNVEGDLNADELAAIQSVVAQAAALAEDFFAGHLPDAFAAARALDIDGGQLARVGLKLRLSEQATYSGQAGPIEQQPGLAAPTPTPTPAPLTSATVEPPAAPASGPSPAAEAPALPAAVPSDAVEPATSGTATTASPSAAAVAQIADFLHDLLETLRDAADADQTATPSIGSSLRLQLYRVTLVELAAALPAESSAETSGVPLAADTLEALAAGQAAPLDAQA